MSVDAELETWRREWQSEAAVPLDLRRRIERQSRWMRIMIAADILVTIVIGGGAIALAVLAPQRDFLVLAAATWLFLAAAWAFRLSSSRGLWAPAAKDTAAFVDLLVRRCRAKLAATAFGAALYACEMAFCLGWIYRHAAVKTPLAEWLLFGSASIDVVWAITLAFFGLLVWYRRRKRAELEWLRSLNYS